MSASVHNFCFPVGHLENDLIKLVPFEVSLHCEDFLDGVRGHPDVYEHLPWGPFETASELETTAVLAVIEPDPGMILYAVMDKMLRPRPTLAGLIGFLNSSVANLCTEIGFIVTLPAFQRTHVTTNAVGLLLHYALDLPELGGLGLRRVQWQASASNQRSVDAAIKLGFRFEGVQRWQRALPSAKSKAVSSNGIPLRGGDPRRENPGRDTAILAICWDDWEEGCRERVDEMMKPKKHLAFVRRGD